MGRARMAGLVRWTLGGLLALGLTVLGAQAADAATLRVGVDCGTGPLPGGFSPTAIQDCVDAAVDDDLVPVPRKTRKGKPNDGYYENVLVDGDQPRVSDSTSDATIGIGISINCIGTCDRGFVRNSTASNAAILIGVGFFVAATSGFEVSGNRAFKNTFDGFVLSTNGASITDNVAERNGVGKIFADAHGFIISVGADGSDLVTTPAQTEKQDRARQQIQKLQEQTERARARMQQQRRR